jgi:restriction system protein
MKRHRRFEFLAGEYLKKEGYEVEVTQGVADWGVDVFAEKDGKRHVVQAKMYGDCKTKITRSMMMELYGVMHYFDCQGAMLIYNGGIMDDAIKVANKLGIQLIYLDQHQLEQFLHESDTDVSDDVFSKIWDEIRQLEGQTIHKGPNTFYHILKVTDGDITYTNKNGKRHRESADLFRRILSRVQSYGSIQQSQLRGEFGTYASAFISTVFANIPSCEVILTPTTIMIR